MVAHACSTMNTQLKACAALAETLKELEQVANSDEQREDWCQLRSEMELMARDSEALLTKIRASRSRLPMLPKFPEVPQLSAEQRMIFSDAELCVQEVCRPYLASSQRFCEIYAIVEAQLADSSTTAETPLTV